MCEEKMSNVPDVTHEGPWPSQHATIFAMTSRRSIPWHRWHAIHVLVEGGVEGCAHPSRGARSISSYLDSLSAHCFQDWRTGEAENARCFRW